MFIKLLLSEAYFCYDHYSCQYYKRYTAKHHIHSLLPLCFCCFLSFDLSISYRPGQLLDKPSELPCFRVSLSSPFLWSQYITPTRTTTGQNRKALFAYEKAPAITDAHTISIAATFPSPILSFPTVMLPNTVSTFITTSSTVTYRPSCKNASLFGSSQGT